MKRVSDIIVAGSALILMSPLLALIVLLNSYFLGSPVFFIQSRPGQNAKLFKLIKFRTMVEAGENIRTSDADRLTNYGKLLRSTSLDELPSLWNVLKGEMSLVGPRPLLQEYLPLYSPKQNRRHEVRPGITGWAQVNGRNAISWEEKFEADVWYVNNQSFPLDLKILWLTIIKVLFRAGINAKGEATMSRFEGSIDDT